MSKIFKLNLKGLNELMKSPEMQGVLNTAAAQIQAQAGDGYEVESAHPISFVAIASVHTGDYKAMLDNSKHNTLLKAAGSVKI
ncbi:MAG: hypothetical protein IIZ96_05320 [Oscillospiraceae bacterium]|nr:hypothetical protein [Oscillospiraceae bacterium]